MTDSFKLRSSVPQAIKLQYVGDDGISSCTLREISLLKALSLKGHHPNIVKLLDVIRADSTLLLVFELLEQDLHR